MLRALVPVHGPEQLVGKSTEADAVLVCLALNETFFHRHRLTGCTTLFYGKIRI